MSFADDASRLRILHVKLTPKAAANRVGEIRTDADGQEVLPVYVTAAPEHNKANDAMVRLLAKYLGIAPSNIAILRGHTNRHKVIEIIHE